MQNFPEWWRRDGRPGTGELKAPGRLVGKREFHAASQRLLVWGLIGTRIAHAGSGGGESALAGYDSAAAPRE